MSNRTSNQDQVAFEAKYNAMVNVVADVNSRLLHLLDAVDAFDLAPDYRWLVTLAEEVEAESAELLALLDQTRADETVLCEGEARLLALFGGKVCEGLEKALAEYTPDDFFLDEDNAYDVPEDDMDGGFDFEAVIDDRVLLFDEIESD